MRAEWHGVGLLAAGLVVVASARPAAANPCPCRDQRVGGRHVYTAAPQKDVRVASESLLFQVQRPLSWWHGMIVEVAVDYVFLNDGGPRALTVGFPVSEGEILAFEATGEGVGGRVVLDRPDAKALLGYASPTECERQAAARTENRAEAYHWFFWKLTLRPGENRMHVRYLQRWLIRDGEVTVSYVLRTARRWGDGRIGTLHIELRDPDRPRLVRWRGTPRPTESRDGGRVLLWSLTDHLAEHDLQVRTQVLPGGWGEDEGGP